MPPLAGDLFAGDTRRAPIEQVTSMHSQYEHGQDYHQATGLSIAGVVNLATWRLNMHEIAGKHRVANAQS
jgi:hypothetical protein